MRLENVEIENQISLEEYERLVKSYIEALSVIKVKLDGLNNDFRRRQKDYPIHNIEERIKCKESIEKKLMRKGYQVTAESARDHITDIAGIRVICFFIEDIYQVVSLIKKHNDLINIKETDYVKHPKANGYKSYHLIIGVPVYMVDGMQYFPVEIQIRTISMEFWACMEHRVVYKNLQEKENRKGELFKKYADDLEKIEMEMFSCFKNQL